MKKEIYEAVEQFFNQLPLPQEVSDCWQNVTKEIPLPADIVVLMDDMYDTVGMASRLLYRMRENNIRVPLFYILGGNNRLLNQNDACVAGNCPETGNQISKYPYVSVRFGLECQIGNSQCGGCGKEGCFCNQPSGLPSSAQIAGAFGMSV